MPKERILIVDDEKNIVSSLTGILSDEGYEVSMTDDGVEALEIIQKDPPDLVLLDIWLPGMDGIEVLKTLKTWSSFFIYALFMAFVAIAKTTDTWLFFKTIGLYIVFGIFMFFEFFFIRYQIKKMVEHQKKADILKKF